MDPRDESQDLELRARTYLHVNCSVCHVEAGGGNSRMQLTLQHAARQDGTLRARPQHDTFGINNAMLVAPGAPERSVLLRRLSQRGRGQMPPLVTNHVDEGAVKLFRDWIAAAEAAIRFSSASGGWTTCFLRSTSLGAGARSRRGGRRSATRAASMPPHRRARGERRARPHRNRPPSRRATEILESILLPSKVVADEYATFLIETG